MDDAWRIMAGAGVPLGPARRPPEAPVDFDELRAALQQISASAEALDEGRRGALVAWLSAFRHHWPTSFERLLGADARNLLQALERQPIAPDRRLKLRRIAIANLSRVV